VHTANRSELPYALLVDLDDTIVDATPVGDEGKREPMADVPALR
jgi:hypothetical protein